MLDDIIQKHHSSETGFSLHYLLLYSITLGLETKKAFEFGSGFSSKAILQALKKTGGSLISCDLRPIEQTGLSAQDLRDNQDRWRYVQEDSRRFVPTLRHEAFDLVLHDGSHEGATLKEDIRNIVPFMKTNSMLLVHDTEHPVHSYGLSKAIRQALRWVKHSAVTLPYGYGLTLIRLEHRTRRGTVQLSWRKRKTAS